MVVPPSIADQADRISPAGSEPFPRPKPGKPLAPITSLRGWLDRLAATDRLAIAKRDVALRHELAAIAKRLDGHKASMFPHPDRHPMSVISGIVSDRGWIAEAMGVAPSELLNRFATAAANPLPWREVREAPAQEVVHRDIDLARLLPLPTHNAYDSGPYITAGLLISRNPRTGAQNVAIHRLQLSAPNRLGVLLLPRHTIAYYEMAEQAGQPLDVAIIVGVDPLTLLASQAIAPLDQDELEIAGALHGAPLDVVRCIGKNVHVPAEAEIVIEGRLLPRERAPEGPFGEFPQYYGERADRHIIEVDLVTQRRDAIFHTIVGGGLEHLMLGGIPREATILGRLRQMFPNVLDVHLSRGGVCRYHLFVRIRKQRDGEAKNIIFGAFASHYDIKHVIVVDEDVDIFNPDEVAWAVATRFQADRDLVVAGGSQGSKLDPSADHGVGAKMGLDATIPLDAEEMRFKRIHVPGENEVDLARVLMPGKAASWRETLQS